MRDPNPHRSVDRDGTHVTIWWVAGEDAYRVILLRHQGDTVVGATDTIHGAQVAHFADAVHCSLPAAADEVQTVTIATLKAKLPPLSVSEALVAGESRRQPGHRVLYTWAGPGWGIEFSRDLLYGRIVP